MLRTMRRDTHDAAASARDNVYAAATRLQPTPTERKPATMHVRSRRILTALMATALLAIAASAATAGRLSVNEKNFEAIWDRAITGKRNLQFVAGGNVLFSCPITMLGSFVERTIKKETLIRQGIVHHATIRGARGPNECEGATATIRSETLPWESRYRSFNGTLPRIREISIGLIRATFRWREPNGVECEFATEVNHPLVGVIGNSPEATETGLETTGEPENITAERANGIPLGGGFFCGFAGEGRFGGLGLVRNLPRTAKIRFTLI